MDVREQNQEEHQHEHVLTLVDLQFMHRDYEEDDDDYDENDLIEIQNFECKCNTCDRRIDWYHRYYYKCSESSCNYSIHSFCKDMPTILKFQGHPSHTLILRKTTSTDEKCHGCFRYYQGGICYYCSTCNYGIDLLCATFVEQNTIHHPSHPHPLISVTVEPILSKCFACGKKHEGRFYHCTTCFNFSINSDCLSLPIKLSLETKQFSHRHLLTLSYSYGDLLYDIECRICGMKFEDEHLIYMCSKCMYYAHPDCATQRIERFMSILSPGLGKLEKNFKDANHPNLLHLPLPDESHNILSHQLKGETSDQKNHLKYLYHQHPLVLILDNEINNNTNISLHDPINRIKLLCNVCTRPITKMPFYKCVDGCDFVVHDWCTRLPRELSNYVGHYPPSHTVYLFNSNSSIFTCGICGLYYNGFSYSCAICKAHFNDVNCAFMPEEITHEAHANHLLTRVRDDYSSSRLSKIECRACRVDINRGEIYFKCSTCDFYLDCRCALYLPKTIRHKFDKHPLKLSYAPIEDHKSEYFCEVCEEGLDPGKWFYHCVECAQSIHSACAPLILQSEQDVNSLYLEGVCKFINIKFGREEQTNVHEHRVSLAPGTENDGLCRSCGSSLQSNVIWKCFRCNFLCHYHCLKMSTHSRFAPRQIDFGGKRMTKHRTQRNIEFYPSETMRPVTRHWKVVDDNMEL